MYYLQHCRIINYTKISLSYKEKLKEGKTDYA